MPRTLAILNKFEEVTSSIALTAMAAIIIVQVFARYVLQSSMDWPEELARYLFIYAVYVGSSYAAQGRRHLEVTVVRTMFGERIGKYSAVLAYVITVAFCGVMFVWGIEMVTFVIASHQVAPALQFPMYLAYVCIPLEIGRAHV
jgi:C4-dicarboxylate transporter DctQ subunit